MRVNHNPNGGDPAVSVVIGFILIVAIGMLALALYQQNAVPSNENAKEIDHHRDATNQLQGVQQAVMQTSNTGNTHSASFTPGLVYGSPGSIFVNSPPAAGTTQVQPYEESVLIENAESDGNAAPYWTGEDVSYDGVSYFSYYPDYEHFQNAPESHIEYGYYYQDYSNVMEGSERVGLTDQPIVDGDSINIVMLSGEFTESQVRDMNVQARPASASENTISVTNTQASEPVRVHLPTRLSASVWEEDILSEQMKSNGGHITDISDGDGDRVVLTFEEGETYELKLSKIHLTTQTSQSSAPEPEAVYAAWVGTEDLTIREDSTMPIGATALDKYNNPVGGADVVSEAASQGNDWDDNSCFGGFQSADENSEWYTTECDDPRYSDGDTDDYWQRGLQTSGTDGDVTFVYEVPSIDGDVHVTFWVCLDEYVSGEDQVCADAESQRDDTR